MWNNLTFSLPRITLARHSTLAQSLHHTASKFKTNFPLRFSSVLHNSHALRWNLSRIFFPLSFFFFLLFFIFCVTDGFRGRNLHRIPSLYDSPISHGSFPIDEVICIIEMLHKQIYTETINCHKLFWSFPFKGKVYLRFLKLFNCFGSV